MQIIEAMEKQNVLSDLELLDLLKYGDRKAFATLYNRHWEKLFLTVVKVVKDDDEASDIIQEVFLSLWLKREDFSLINSVSGWLFGAVRKKSLMFIRANIVRNNYLESLNIHLLGIRDSLGEEQSAKELEAIINAEVEKLPSKMREIFRLSRHENLTHKEIAARLQISDKTVKKQINNVLKHLRIKLDDKSTTSLSILIILMFKG